MADDKADARGVTVPTARLTRLMRLGGLVGGIAGGMLVDGARQVASGKRPTLQDLLMTPANALKVTQQLAQMRGAAMKVGQLLSMDAGDLCRLNWRPFLVDCEPTPTICRQSSCRQF